MANTRLYNKVQIPDFFPKYKNKVAYGYTRRGKQRENLKKLLLETSEMYCMYCYRRVYIDGIDYSQIEHAIEKGSGNNKLLNCVPNLGLSCSVCNISAKRKNENLRKQYIENKPEYRAFLQHECSPATSRKDCPCDDYKKLVNVFHEGPYGHICLKPGMTIIPRSGNRAKLQYDIFKGKFEAATDDYSKFTADDWNFVEDHIEQFNLNDPEKRSDAFYNYCRDVINGKVSCRARGLYNNYIVDLFIDHVEDLSDESVLEICKQAFKRAKAIGRID